jgi:succinyl-CoA synthetase alpha subunit
VSNANVKARGERAGRSQKHPMEECGIKVTRNPAEMGKLLKTVLK